jgi:hypothetical protein
MSTRLKNSARISIHNPDAQKKDNIKNKAEFTGLREVITCKAAITKMPAKA